MQMIKAFNETIRYIESELDGEIDESRVAMLSGYSFAMFSRLFSILTDMMLSGRLNGALFIRLFQAA